MLKPRTRIGLVVAVVLFVGALVAGATFARPIVVGVCWMLGLGDSTYYGWHTSRLRAGDRVVLSQEFRVMPADQVIHRKGDDYEWPGVAPAGDIVAPKGAQALVKVDPAWDEDSCYPTRPVAITLLPSNIDVAVPRTILHR
jgi:hypothetical protein